MEIWTRLIAGQNLELWCRCFATFFCGDAVFVIFFRGVAMWTVPQCPPRYFKPLRNGNTFLHVIYKSKKKANLSCILNDVFQYSARFEHENEMRRKALKQKKIGIQHFLEAGIHWDGIQNPVLGIRNPQGGIQNPRLSWIPLHGAMITHTNFKVFNWIRIKEGDVSNKL